MYSSEPNLFDGAEVISSYTDANALADGVLVDVSKAGDPIMLQAEGHAALPLNRVTVTVYHKLLRDAMRHLPIQDALREITAEGRVNHFDQDWIVYDFFEEHKEQPYLRYDFKLWAVPNEVGGYTLMFPEDY